MPPESTGAPLLAFIHIEKAAGTSLIHFLRRSFLLRYADVRPLQPVDDRRLRASDVRTYQRLVPGLRVIAGHSVTAVSDLHTLGRPIRYFTVMRDPVARYLSQYQYWVRVLGRDITMEAFLDDEDTIDWQTRKLAGSGSVEEATARIEADNILVGTVSELELFIAQLARVAGIERPVIEQKNTAGSDREQRNDLIERWGDAIRERNANDQALYDWVLRERIPAQSAELADAGPAEQGDPGTLARLAAWTDYAFRKAWLEPVTGALRRRRGMPSQGSY